MVSMNFRRDPHTGRMWLEINPRAAGASLLLAQRRAEPAGTGAPQVCRPPRCQPDPLAGLRYRHGRADLRAPFFRAPPPGREPLLRGLPSINPRTVFRLRSPPTWAQWQMTLDWLLGKLRGSGRWVWMTGWDRARTGRGAPVKPRPRLR